MDLRMSGLLRVWVWQVWFVGAMRVFRAANGDEDFPLDLRRLHGLLQGLLQLSPEAAVFFFNFSFSSSLAATSHISLSIFASRAAKPSFCFFSSIICFSLRSSFLFCVTKSSTNLWSFIFFWPGNFFLKYTPGVKKNSDQSPCLLL